MSHIPNKKPQMPPSFGALNPRKPPVGNTYGERLHYKEVAAEKPSSTWEKTKDFFRGGKNPKNISQFSNATDRYEEPKRSHFVRVQNGHAHQANVQRPPADKYVGYLDKLISLLDTHKKAQKK